MQAFQRIVTDQSFSVVPEALPYLGVTTEMYPQVLPAALPIAQPVETAEPSIMLDELDPIAYSFRVENQPEKIVHILRKLHTSHDPRRTELAQELERCCGGLSSSMLGAFMETKLLDFLFEITRKVDLPIYAFSKTEGEKKCLNQHTLDYACAVIRTIQLLVVALLKEDNTDRVKRLVPLTVRLCETLLKVLWARQEPTGRWGHDEWKATHVTFRQAVDDLIGGCFDLALIDSDNSRRLGNILSALIMRSWVRAYPTELYYKMNIIKLALRLFSEGLPLDQRGFVNGNMYATLRQVFSRELHDRSIVGADLATLAQTISACLECHPRIITHVWLEEIFYREVRDSIKWEHARVKSLTASAEQFTAIKHLTKLVRQLLGGIPFSTGPGEDIRPPLKVFLWLFWIHDTMLKAAAWQDKELFDDCRWILAQEGPRYVQTHRCDGQRAYSHKCWLEIREEINYHWRGARNPTEKKWFRKVVDFWVDVGKAYGWQDGEAAPEI
ncbi:hypothetical protein PHLGIDRAFT_127870 [Phlebiopsis gigantea 11061_1 CR5-6]|uniref:Uncharacterized protein n=1 Tax=Phlebiopsis gigantea (strain 11061_1 CR5-6) TaxID=745531 RepID=A0A0C3SAJ2_PHLG1|nr:hypothetical protein PHLGIDRAFT_127870 [Phlebiopsis gigantea 11061_1 CR5-6]